jgi:UDP-N-acetylmuramyl pentapeptide synthase
VGPNDAHAYIKELIAVQNFVVTIFQRDVKEMLISLLSKILRVLYKNLQPIIAAFLIFLSSDNGSNGKTIVKEWLNFY